MSDKYIVNDNELENVVGGTQSEEFTGERNAFETAWNAMGKETSSCSGMKKAEVFDEWTMANCPADVTGFIRKYL